MAQLPPNGHAQDVQLGQSIPGKHKFMKSISNFLSNWATVTTLISASIVTVGIVAPSASALSLVPQQEGEVQLINSGFTPIGPLVTLPDLIKSVESLDNPDGSFSRLFVDDLTTANNYGGTIRFGAGDLGTFTSGFWYRPSELEEENGQLEVGKFQFMFTETLPKLTIEYFDTETSNTTGVPSFLAGAETDGILVDGENPVPAGADGNIYTQTWENISFITLKLGNDKPFGTGDGVQFQLEAELLASVPEPGTVFSLGTLAMAGGLGLRKRNKKSDA